MYLFKITWIISPFASKKKVENDSSKEKLIKEKNGVFVFFNTEAARIVSTSSDGCWYFEKVSGSAWFFQNPR